MPKERDVTSDIQLELEFDTASLTGADKDNSYQNNIVRVEFGKPRPTRNSCTNSDQVLINRILQNAQRLKW